MINTEDFNPEEPNETPRSVCDGCGASFYIYWDRSPTIERVEFCPFCGGEAE